MPNLTSVTVTAGVPTAGTGTVSTLDNLIGTAGTPSAQALTVQGVTSMTALKVDGSGVTQPVSLTSTTITGTVAVTESGTWTVRNQDGSGNSLTSTGGALDINIKSGANANGQATMANSAPIVLANNQTYPTGMSPRGFSAAFSTLTRPANTTAYTALDSISDNATAGSVTALSATISDTNDDPLTLTEILVVSTDTGLAGKRVRAYLFNSDPTASSGVGAGDNTAYLQKHAGYVGSFSGVLETGFSDGAVGRLVPSYADGAASGTPNAAAGGFVVTKPTAGAKTLYIQYQAVDGFTPSASSTTIIGTARGYQGRAA